MAQPGLQTVVQHLRKMVDGDESVADAELLARFAGRRDESAFTLLVERHGPMVLGVCRRMLRRSADAEDGWQATFLILARKAPAIRKQASVAAWLHGVALRVCQRIREKAQRDKHKELPGDLIQVEHDDLSWREVQRILDEEVQRLPERLRQPIVLCYLEGKTRDEAAEELGWTLTTFRGRLDTARERLRKSLVKRGLTLPTALLATLLSQASEVAAIPQALLDGLLPAAITGSTPSTLVPLIEGGIQAMTVSKIPALLSIVLAVGLFGGGSALLVQNRAVPNNVSGLYAAEQENGRFVEAPKKDDPALERIRDAELLRKVLASDRIVMGEPGQPYFSIRGSNGNLNVEKENDLDNRPFIKDHNIRFIHFVRSMEEGSPLPKLYAIDPKDWYIEHTPEIKKKIRALIPLPREWGQTKNGLRMGLLPRKAAFNKNDDIAIDVAIQNTSDKDVSVKQLRYNIYDYWLLTFQIETPTGRTLILSKPVGAMREFDTPTTRVLKPGETYVHTVRLNRWLAANQKDWLADAGSYTVAASNAVVTKWERAPADFLASSKITFEVADEDPEAKRLKDLEAHADRLQVSFQLAPVDPKGVANPPYPLRYVYLNVLPIPLEPHGKWPNGTPIGADARITKEQAGKIVAALARLGFVKAASSAIPEFHRNGPHAGLTVRYRPDGVMENKQLWLPLDWDLKMLRHLQALRQCVDGDAARHLDAMLESLEADRKKWEDNESWGAEVDGLQLRGRSTQAQWKAGEQPTFEIDLRNRGKKSWTITAVPPLVEVEVDGKWYTFSRELDFKAAIRNLKAGEQVNKWMTVAPDKTWGHGGEEDEPRIALDWKPGKHRVRLAYSIQGKAHLHSQVFDIEIVDPKEVGWGEPVQDIQIRLRQVKTLFQPLEMPVFEIDLINRSKQEIIGESSPPEIEIDGVWYKVTTGPAKPLGTNKVKAGELFHTWAAFLVAHDAWVRKDSGNKHVPLKMTPGKHTIRAAYPFTKEIRPITKAIEYELGDPKKLGWGEPQGNIHIRIDAAKSKVPVGEVPLFYLDVMNASKHNITAERFVPEIEVNGVWYSMPVPDIALPTGTLPANERVNRFARFEVTPDAWIIKTPNDKLPRKLKLPIGKHTIRAAFPQANEARPVSEPIEFEIVDPKDLGWDKAVEGFELRGRSTKATWVLGEMPVFVIDSRSRGPAIEKGSVVPDVTQIELQHLPPITAELEIVDLKE